MFFKGCPKCSGDVYMEETATYLELVCLQCGNRRPVPMRYRSRLRRRMARPAAR
jgi:hypothetical protein